MTNTRQILLTLLIACGGCVESAPSTPNSATPNSGTTNSGTTNSGTDAGDDPDSSVNPGERTLVLRVATTLEVLVEEPVEAVVVEMDGSETSIAVEDLNVISVTGAELESDKLVAAEPGTGGIEVEYDGLFARAEFEVTFELQRITASFDVACVTTQRGRVWCWGTNENGELGRGDFSTSADQVFALGPALYTFDAPVIDIDCGLDACVAVTEAGSIFSWGSREDSRLGRTTNTIENPTPELVELNGFDAVEVSFEAEHGCALDRDGKIACWGNNERGQLGEGSQNDRTIRLYDSVRASAVEVGNDATCYIDQMTESVSCAGSAAWLPSSAGDLLNFTTMIVPPGVTPQADAIGVGDQHFCAVAGPDVWCVGELRSFDGPPDNFNVSLGAKVDLPKASGNFLQLIADDDMNFLQSDNGNWYSFGENERGVAGTQNSMSDYDGPRIQAPANEPIRWIATGNENTCIITESSKIFCVGNDNAGLLGPSANSTSETWVEILPPWN